MIMVISNSILSTDKNTISLIPLFRATRILNAEFISEKIRVALNVCITNLEILVLYYFYKKIRTF